MMNIRPLRWLLFAIAFFAVHLAFALGVLVREMASTSGGRDIDMGILGAFVIIAGLGPRTAAEFAIGYALFDTTVGTRTGRSSPWHRYAPLVAGLTARWLLFVGLSFRSVLPKLSKNLVDSYLLGIGVPWAAVLLGGLSGALTAVVGIAVNRRPQRRLP